VSRPFLLQRRVSRFRRIWLVGALVSLCSLRASEVIVLRDSLQRGGTPTSGQWVEALHRAGLTAADVAPEDLADRLATVAADPRGTTAGAVLLLPDAVWFPADALPALRTHLQRGGALIAVGGPAFSRVLTRHPEGWKETDAAAASAPVLEGLSPAYKLHAIAAHSLITTETRDAVPYAGTLLAALPRSPGFGSDALRRWRQIPLAYARDAGGELRGIAAHLLLSQIPGLEGAIWGAIAAPATPSPEVTAWSQRLALAMIRRIQRGAFLANAGPRQIAVAEGDALPFGAFVIDRVPRAEPLIVRFRISRGGTTVQTREVAVTASAFAQTAGKPRSAARTDDPKNPVINSTRTPQFVAGETLRLAPGDYAATTTLLEGGAEVDSITQPFRIIAFPVERAVDRVTVTDGDFRRNGRPWHPLGLNYWPRYVAGLEAADFNDAVWSPDLYDPEIVEVDLALARRLGLTVISIAYSRVEQAGAVMDLLARAERHDLKVNVYLPGLHPLRPDFPRAETLIRAAHLPESPAVFAYDLGWEVRVGTRSERVAWDAAWLKWVVDQYGSVAAAAEDWGIAPPLEDGKLVGASDEQLKTDGPWRAYVAAYRRFWDDTISRGYREVRRFIRTLDEHTLLGARSGYGGTGAEWIAEHLPFDLASGAKHLDFISPEHYEDSLRERDFMRSAFTTAYARLVSGGKPVFWSEFGRPVAWKTDASAYALEPAAEALQRQADYFRGVLDMVYRSGANGAAGWWWPAGYRVDERSDFGLVRPDLGLRPAAEALVVGARRFSTPPPELPIAGEQVLDRDRYVTGYAGLYGAHSLGYADALLAGAVPQLRTSGTGTNSASTPLVAVGNRPVNGRNPPRFLNAEFNQITLNGVPVTDGATLDVAPGEPLIVAASVGNIAEASWLASPATAVGSVQLLVRWDGGEALAPIAADTPFLADATVPPFPLPTALAAPVELRFRMTAAGRTTFGELVRIMVQSKPPR
jgi:hypothetical protein